MGLATRRHGASGTARPDDCLEAANLLSRPTNSSSLPRRAFSSTNRMGSHKQLILHIGRAKSGTSTLQTYLTTHREKLAAQGICFPRAGCGTSAAHHDLAHACLADHPNNGLLLSMRSALEAEAAPFDTVIVSSEAFQNLHASAALNFMFGQPGPRLFGRSLLWRTARSYRIKTICYVREFLEFAASSYAQKIHESSYTGTLRPYCGENFTMPLATLVRVWRRFSDQVIFVYYDRSTLLDGDIVADFFDRMELLPPSPIRPADFNPSLSGNLLAFKLLINLHGAHSMAYYNAFSELARSDPRYRGKLFISDEEAHEFRSNDRGYNAQLARLVGPIKLGSFEGGNRFNPDFWANDLEHFLSHPALVELKKRPEIYRTPADDIAAAMNL